AVDLRSPGAPFIQGGDSPEPFSVLDQPPLPDAGLCKACHPASGGRGMAIAYELAAQALQMFLVLAVAPFVLGVTRMVKARLLRRIGPPAWQPYLDLWKLMHKEAVLAHNATWLYRAAPYLV